MVQEFRYIIIVSVKLPICRSLSTGIFPPHTIALLGTGTNTGRGTIAISFFSPTNLPIMEYEVAEERSWGIGDVEAPKELEVTFGKGLCGTLAFPHAESDPDYLQKGFAPSTGKIALILHGQGGHRNYCYQKMVAHKLAAELGMYSLRIDFRGSGSLAENADTDAGRLLLQDLEDIDAAVDFIRDGEKHHVGVDFLLLSIIAHSRGGVAMFLWACKQQELLKSTKTAASAVVVPNLINCSLRFRSHTILDRYNFVGPDEIDVITLKALRHGKYVDTIIPKDEIMSLATADLTPIEKLSPEWSVLSIYGTRDDIIPKEDCAYFANALNRGRYTHHLELIDDADHNFFGVHPIEDEDDQQRLNRYALPVTKNKLVNFNYLVSATVIKYLRFDQELLRFNARAAKIGGVPRVKAIDGIANCRDVGGWKIDVPRFRVTQNENAKYYVRAGYVFRCANTAALTKNGAKTLRDLKIDTVYDLRSIEECNKDVFPEAAFEIASITRVHSPVFRHEDYSPEQIALRFSNLITSWHTYVHVYDQMLANGQELFRRMFEHVRDRPDHPFMFHCTAGKDRTGVFAMLLLRLVGVDRQTIIKEYELTTLGLKPDHEKIRQLFISGLEKMKSKGLSALENSIVQGRSNWTFEKDGFDNLISSRSEAMLATLELLDTSYGGIVNYMLKYLSFSDAEIEQIFKNLVCVVDQGAEPEVQEDVLYATSKF